MKFPTLRNPFRKSTSGDAAADDEARALRGELELRDSLKQVESSMMQELLHFTSSKAGIKVTPKAALGVPTVFACVRRITDTMVTLPIHLKRMRGGFAEEVTANPLHNVVRYEPNSLMTAADFMDAMQGQLTLRKNAYAVIHFDRVGRPAEMVPVDDPRKVSSKIEKDGRRWYRIEGYSEPFEEREILHLRSNTAEGMLGRDLIGGQSDAIGLAIALVDNASDFFKNGSRPSAVFKHPRKLHDDVYKRLKEDLSDKWSGSGNNYKTMLLEEGMEYVALRHSNNESQMIETRKEQGYELARMFGVPPHKVGIMDKSSFNNIESQNREYAVDTILPLVTRWEMELNRKLLTPRQRVQGFHFSFNMDALLRPDLKARYEAHEISIRSGMKNKDECRKIEGLAEIPDGLGKIYVESQNYKPLGQDPTNVEGVNSED